ncbi:hypothetical protein KQX54_016034 [Cotesia glomerata]|uniref:Uncharacterized protein n=1 Tax=Cotesia glomerata TaxID=32391 RepID=A0AAV7HTZ4_COTGL|nr:hypothetical protein KQX54_016034 [Cotesia glomerata]
MGPRLEYTVAGAAPADDTSRDGAGQRKPPECRKEREIERENESHKTQRHSFSQASVSSLLVTFPLTPERVDPAPGTGKPRQDYYDPWDLLGSIVLTDSTKWTPGMCTHAG